jgi:excisionase family DNA binding protein
VTVNQAAEHAEVSPALVYGWVSSGMLPHYRLGAKGRRGKISIKESDLEALLESMRREGQASMPTTQAAVRLKHLKL